MKGKVYRCRVRSAILYGSETWCLKENEKAILRRTERAMCGQKVVDRKTTEEQMDMLGLMETIDRLQHRMELDGMDMCQGGMTIVF